MNFGLSIKICFPLFVSFAINHAFPLREIYSSSALDTSTGVCAAAAGSASDTVSASASSRVKSRFFIARLLRS